MVTYDQWNKAIISYFFEDCEPGQIIFLQTDADTLFDIAENSEFSIADANEAADSLTAAVRDKVVYCGSVDFWKINPTRTFLLGNHSEEEPPQVAFLALTVLAASLMDSEGSIASNNYYIRLNELLFGQSIKGAPPRFDRLEFEEFWKHLQRYLRDQHDAILYLTEGASKRRYVWYPISQCLISKHDQRGIYRFFQNYGVIPFSDILDSQLEKKLRTWLQSSDGSAKIKRYFSNESYKESILSQVKFLFKHWDGEVLPEPLPGERQTTSSIRVELRFEQFDNVEIRYWFSRRGRNKINCKTNLLEIQYLQPSSHLEKWFRPVIDSSGTFWNLQESLQLRTDETNSVIYTLGLSDIWVFREDLDRDNSWLSQRNMQLGEKHLIIFRKHLISQVMNCLEKVCEQEIGKPGTIYVDGKEVDWLSLRVEPTKFLFFSDQKLWKLSVTAGKRLSLIGGFPVTYKYEHKAYLDICLPNVFVPDLGLSDQEVLRIDEQEFSLDKDRLVTLHNVLGPGVYQLVYGGQTKKLRVISPERSLKHHDQTLVAAIYPDRAAVPDYLIKEVAEVSGKFGLWLIGGKFFGTDVPQVSWEAMEKVPEPSELDSNGFFKVPANIISSVIRVAISFKQGQVSVPEGLDEAIEYLDQNVALRAIVEKKLNVYNEIALSYVELREQIGR